MDVRRVGSGRMGPKLSTKEEAVTRGPHSARSDL
jgi:hypothetical protein